MGVGAESAKQKNVQEHRDRKYSTFEELWIAQQSRSQDVNQAALRVNVGEVSRDHEISTLL